MIVSLALDNQDRSVVNSCGGRLRAPLAGQELGWNAATERADAFVDRR